MARRREGGMSAATFPRRDVVPPIDSAAKHPIALAVKDLASAVSPLEPNTVLLAADAAFFRGLAKEAHVNGTSANTDEAARYRRAIHELGVAVLGDLCRAVGVPS